MLVTDSLQFDSDSAANLAWNVIHSTTKTNANSFDLAIEILDNYFKDK